LAALVLALALAPPMAVTAVTAKAGEPPDGDQGPAPAKEATPRKTDAAETRKDTPEKQKWQSLFDGRSLGKWKVIDKFDYKRHGKVYVRDGRIVLEAGKPATGIRWTGPFPKIDYEVTLEAMRVEGNDFFCALTFPVGDAALTLVLGGWRGSIVGLSLIDGELAVENETCQYKDFDQRRWYRVHLRVTESKIEAWIDEEQVVDLATAGRKLTVSWEMEPPLPFGVATWYTTGALRDMRVRRIDGESAERNRETPRRSSVLRKSGGASVILSGAKNRVAGAKRDPSFCSG
jgi:hypothetical protein